jgi:uncharacterized protein YbjT (DUF2867 family)
LILKNKLDNLNIVTMNYVITGGAGNVSAPLVKNLLAAGKQVTVIGRNAGNLNELIQAGATAAIGSVEDVDFLTKAFNNADAAYTMIPPKFETENWKKYVASVAENYAAAIKASKIKHVVNLSSVGAHLPDGAGPISAFFYAERALNSVEGVSVLHLRPSFFYQNLLASIPLVKNAGIIGSNFSISDNKFPLVDPTDIAQVAFQELVNLEFRGNSFRYIASDEVSTDSIAQAIGNAIGKPDLKWVMFSDGDALQEMMSRAGLSREIAKNLTQMHAALNVGSVTEDYWQKKPLALGKVKLADFANVFSRFYAAS